MRVIFAGTPDFAARHLDALLQDERFEVVAVYTQPDRPAGRGKKLQPSAVKQRALASQIPVEQPERLKDPEAQQRLAQYQADIMVVVAYGLLLPQVVLDIPKRGCVNVHGSLLPRWRGAAPIQRAIWAGDRETGVTIMQMDAGLDTGPMLSKVTVPISNEDTSASLYEKLAQLGPQALIESLLEIAAGTSRSEAQDDSQATYAKKLSKEEALIDWQQSALFIERCIRAFNPWPGTEFYVSEHRIKVWHAIAEQSLSNQTPGTILAADKQGILVQCGDQTTLRLLSLQPPGKKPMTCQDILNARSSWFEKGTLLGVAS